MVNTGISAVLGLGYWLVAARYYSDEAVGQGSAAIAAMKFLAGLTAVTLIGALARFIPVAGRTTRTLILRTYAASSLLVALAATVFLLTLGLWGPSYGFLRGWLPGLGFVAAVVGWSLLTLQDGVLTGLRSAAWVPAGNTAFSVVKLALLVGLAAAVPTAGVFVSWAAAIAVSVVPLGWLVLRRLVPRHVAATARAARPAPWREMGRFLAGDYTGALFSLAVVYLVPVLVAAQVSAADNAYFYVTVTISGTVNLLALNMGSSLTVEGAHNPALLAAHCRAALGRMLRIMVPVCALLFVFAPQILGVFGPGYAASATGLLRWYAVGALLRVVIELYFAVLRARSRTAGLAWLQGVLCTLVLTLTLVLLPALGLAGAGMAEVASLGVVAVVAAVRLRGVLRGPGGADGSARTVDGPRTAGGADGGTASATAGGADGGGTGGGPPAGGGPDEGPDRRPDPQPRPSPAARLRARLPARWAGPGRPPPAALARWLGLAAATALFWVPLRGFGEAELDAMGGLGLVSVLPGPTLLGAAGLAVCFGLALARRVPDRALLGATLVLTLLALHAVPAVVEAEPRFATAWQHLGFLDYIDRTGVTAPELDARWSWPGFFAVTAFVAQACGVEDLTGVLRWWPTAMQVLYLAPFAVLLRAFRVHWRARWTAAWFFVLCGWVGQDYFSPQGFTYLLYLAFAAVLLRWLRPRPARPGPRTPGEAAVPEVSRSTRAVLLGVVLALFAASVTAHQLTPFVMLGLAGGLLLARRLGPRGLPLLGTVLVAAWVGFLAESYWSGHFDELFGGLGGLTGNVSSSVAGRIEGGSQTHKLVLYTRVALAGGTLALAAFGAWRRRRAGYGDRCLLLLAAVPFGAFGLQSYGGEMALRVFLFTAPGACLLAALAFFPREGDRAGAPGRVRRWAAPGAALLAGLVLLGGFLVARWGNESFERVRPGEVAAMEYVYAHDRPSAGLLWLSSDPATNLTPALPWGARDMERVRYLPVQAPTDPTRTDDLVAGLRAAGPGGLLMVNAGQSAYLELDAGYPATWEARLREALEARPELRRVFEHRDAAVYTLRDPPPGAGAAADPGPPGPRVTWTDWSVTGALCVLLVLLLLTGRELLRVLAPPGPRRDAWLPATLWFTVPLMLVAAAALVHRLMTLS
ncbi:lipopolysaccharide biosynthesis protein [Streptomyces sp. TRM 70351]|nr:lipopolysaccharide biosynthesis protein [Streptomyces sp. TRM 70351]MEE1929249.1 lipopolysaccharide biosynthesis protein [Streptomyces sp. TRM 70351]